MTIELDGVGCLQAFLKELKCYSRNNVYVEFWNSFLTINQWQMLNV